MTDDVLQGVRAAREAFAAAHGYDVRAMVAALQRLNEAGDWPVVSLPPRSPQGDDTADRLSLFAGRTVAELAADIRATVPPPADPAGA